MTAPIKLEGMSMGEFLERTRQRPIKLSDGEIIEMSPTISWHSIVLDNARSILDAEITGKKLGRVFVETTYILPDATLKNWVKGSRVPDVMYYEHARFVAYLKANPDWKDYPFALIPDLVMEVLSPNDRYSDVMRDVNNYLSDGVKIILVLDADKQTVVMHTPNAAQALVLGRADMLNLHDLLPDFAIRVSAFFAVAEETDTEASDE
jgi:Uma2 family endonuclease